MTPESRLTSHLGVFSFQSTYYIGYRIACFIPRNPLSVLSIHNDINLSKGIVGISGVEKTMIFSKSKVGFLFFWFLLFFFVFGFLVYNLKKEKKKMHILYIAVHL